LPEKYFHEPGLARQVKYFSLPTAVLLFCENS